MLTADTITDEQIRELLHPKQKLVVIAQVFDALSDFVSRTQRHDTRARCAEILNARAAKDLGVGDQVVGVLDTGGELRGEIVALIGHLATVRTAAGRTFTRSLGELTRAAKEGR